MFPSEMAQCNLTPEFIGRGSTGLKLNGRFLEQAGEISGSPLPFSKQAFPCPNQMEFASADLKSAQVGGRCERGFARIALPDYRTNLRNQG
jgi:hypothetical protein